MHDFQTGYNQLDSTTTGGLISNLTYCVDITAQLVKTDVPFCPPRPIGPNGQSKVCPDTKRMDVSNDKKQVPDFNYDKLSSDCNQIKPAEI